MRGWRRRASSLMPRRQSGDLMHAILPAQLRAALAGPCAASGELCFWMVVAMVFRAFVADSIWGAAPLSQKLATLAFMILTGCSVLAAARWTWLRASVTTGAAPALTLLTYGIAGFAIAASQAAVDPRISFALAEQAARAAMCVAVLTTLAFVLDQRRRQRAAVTDLITQTRRLERSRAFYLTEVARIRSDLDRIVTAQTGPALSACLHVVESLSSANASVTRLREAAERIRQSESGVVRELSHALDGGTGELTNSRPPDSHAEPAGESNGRAQKPQGGVEAKRIRGRRFSRRQSDVSDPDGRAPGYRSTRDIVQNALSLRPFWPAPLTAGIALGCASSSIPQRGLAIGMSFTVLAVVFVFAATTFADRHLTPFMRRSRTIVQIATGAAVLAIVAGFLGVAFRKVDPSVTAGKAAVVLFCAELLVATLVAFARAFAFARRESIQELSATLESISWETARLQDDELQIRREVASALHGDTQSRLLAVAISLDNLADSLPAVRPDAADEVLGQAAAALRQTLGKLSSIGQNCGNTVVADIQMALEATASVWSAIVDVRIDCPNDVAASINRSPAVATAAAHAVRESISNACRHGRASRVDVSLRVVGHATEIRAVDDGLGVHANYVPGLGLTSMVRSGARVELVPSQLGGTELLVQLPIT